MFAPLGSVVTCTGALNGESATKMRASESLAAPTRPLANTIFPFGPGIAVAGADAQNVNTPSATPMANDQRTV